MGKGCRELRKERGDPNPLALTCGSPHIKSAPPTLGRHPSPHPHLAAPGPGSQLHIRPPRGMRKAGSSAIACPPGCYCPSCRPCPSTPWPPDRPPGDCSQEVPRFQAHISQKPLAEAASSLKRLHVILQSAEGPKHKGVYEHHRPPKASPRCFLTSRRGSLHYLHPTDRAGIFDAWVYDFLPLIQDLSIGGRALPPRHLLSLLSPPAQVLQKQSLPTVPKPNSSEKERTLAASRRTN